MPLNSNQRLQKKKNRSKQDKPETPLTTINSGITNIFLGNQNIKIIQKEEITSGCRWMWLVPMKSPSKAYGGNQTLLQDLKNNNH